MLSADSISQIFLFLKFVELLIFTLYHAIEFGLEKDDGTGRSVHTDSTTFSLEDNSHYYYSIKVTLTLTPFACARIAILNHNVAIETSYKPSLVAEVFLATS
jgi:hypothetical protein